MYRLFHQSCTKLNCSHFTCDWDNIIILVTFKKENLCHKKYWNTHLINLCKYVLNMGSFLAIT